MEDNSLKLIPRRKSEFKWHKMYLIHSMESINSFWIPAAYSCQHFCNWKIITYGIEDIIHLRKFSPLIFDAN